MTEAMGHGVNQRKAIQMTPDEVDAFLAERRNMTMCSISHDGSIHAVAMWYGFLDGCVTVETKAKSQKVQNLRRDPRLTLLFEDGDYYEELRGVELVGQGGDRRRPRQAVAARHQRLRALQRAVHRRAQADSGDHVAQAGGGEAQRRADRQLGPPQAGTAVHAPDAREIQHPAGGGRAAGPGDGGLRLPAFYEGRPARDDIEVREVVRHEATGDRVLLEVRFAFTGSVSPAVRAVVDPAKMSWVTRTEILLAEGRSSWVVLPDHYPDRLSASGIYRFEEGDGGPGTC